MPNNTKKNMFIYKNGKFIQTAGGGSGSINIEDLPEVPSQDATQAQLEAAFGKAFKLTYEGEDINFVCQPIEFGEDEYQKSVIYTSLYMFVGSSIESYVFISVAIGLDKTTGEYYYDIDSEDFEDLKGLKLYKHEVGFADEFMGSIVVINTQSTPLQKTISSSDLRHFIENGINAKINNSYIGYMDDGDGSFPITFYLFNCERDSYTDQAVMRPYKATLTSTAMNVLTDLVTEL